MKRINCRAPIGFILSMYWFCNADYYSSWTFNYAPVRTKTNQGRIKRQSVASCPSITGFHLHLKHQSWGHWARKTAAEQKDGCLHSRAAESTRMGCRVSWGHCLSRQGGWMHQLTMAVTEQKVVRQDGQGGKAAALWHVLCWDLREDKTLHSHRSTNLSDGRCTFLTHCGVSTWFTFWGYSTSKNTKTSVGRWAGLARKKKRTHLLPFSFSLSL